MEQDFSTSSTATGMLSNLRLVLFRVASPLRFLKQTNATPLVRSNGDIGGRVGAHPDLCAFERGTASFGHSDVEKERDRESCQVVADASFSFWHQEFSLSRAMRALSTPDSTYCDARCLSAG